MKRFKQLLEDIQLDAYAEPAEMSVDNFNKKYLQRKERGFIDLPNAPGRKFIEHKNLGEIHPGYELWRHTTQLDTAIVGGLPVRKTHHDHKFSIVHKKTKKKIGEIDASGGAIDRESGKFTHGKGKALQIKYLGVNSKHSSKKVGTSLAVAAYKHLHSLGHSIKSDTLQTLGGASVWDTLRNHPDTKNHMMMHDERTGKSAPAHTRQWGDIWRESGATAHQQTLVLHAKKGNKK